MAVLVNGNGNESVYAQQDADLLQGLAGNVSHILKVGAEFAYEIPDANTLRVQNGAILTKEGRRIQLDVDTVDEFTIPTGQQSTTKYFIVGYRLYVDSSDSTEKCEKFIQEVASATATITEGTLRSGDTEVFISLYRLKQTGLLFEVQEKLLDTINQLSDILTLDPNIQQEIQWSRTAGPAVSDWSSTTTAIGGASYYTAQRTLSAGYNDYLEMAIAPSGTNILPTQTEATNFGRINFTTWDKATKTITFYAKQKPSAQFYIYVRGGE